MDNLKVPQLQPTFKVAQHRDYRDLLHTCDEQYGEKAAFIIKTKKAKRGEDAEYREVTYHTFRKECEAVGAGLYERGYLGRKIAFLGNNSYEWLLGYFGTLLGVGIAVPLDKGLPCEETKSSLLRCGAQVLFFDKAHLADARDIAADPTQHVELICMNDTDEFPTLGQIMAEGAAALESGKTDFLELPIDPDACSILIFTSGTSSLAKAVQLSQHNVMYDVYAMQLVEDIQSTDMSMAFLPFHHTFGIGAQLVILSAGATMTFCDGLKYIQKNMVEYGVSCFVGVPLLVEAIWKKVLNGIEKKGQMQKFRRGVKLSNFLRKFGIDRRRKFFAEIHEQLGGRLEQVISGASALDPEVQRGFEEIGIHVCQGYGMTEASPCIAAETPTVFRPGSIGKALPGMEVEIFDPNEDGIGELICRAPNVMLGYYNNPEETAGTLMDGWLHTGDLARMDSDGFLFITGRAKNVIVLRNGKNVYPEELETLIANLPYVKENIVIGEPRQHDDNWKDLALVAKIVYDPDYFKENRGITDSNEIEASIRADLDRINEGLPNYQRILRLSIQEHEMKKTTTGKVKRFEEGARKTV